MTVYLDIIFLENIFMNYIILFATGYIMKQKFKPIRIILSSCLGSLYAILGYMQNIMIFSNIIVKIILSIVMILIAFNPKRLKQLFKEIILFYLISFVFGGCAIFLLYLLKPQNVFMKNGVYVGNYPIKIALLGGIVGFAFTHMAFKLVKSKISKEDIYINLKVFFKDKEVELKAIMDTGNMLKDPISGIPVIIVCKNKLYGLLPEDILDNLDDIINGNFSKNIFINNGELFSKFRMIPFSSIGMQNGILLGFKVDKIEITVDETIKTIDDVIIGIYKNKLSKDDEYAALIGLNVFERREENEFASSNKI